MEESTKLLDISKRDLELLNTKTGVQELLSNKELKPERVLNRLRYYDKLVEFQAELIKMQQWVSEKNKRVVILFEGRDAAGKGGAIRRFIGHMNPRLLRQVALPAPTPVEKGQWYFQRYITQLPNPGEIVFFDRSWYNRAVVEPVNGFCTKKQYKQFMTQVVDFEKMLDKDGIQVIKLWFSITKEEQQDRFERIRQDPLKHWKLSPVDDRALELWDDYGRHKEEMFRKTNNDFCQWAVIQANIKTKARIEAIKYVLGEVDYPKDEKTMRKIKVNNKVLYQLKKGEINLPPD